MKRTELVKAKSPAPSLVGVISSREDFRVALRAGAGSADSFEIRLDNLRDELDFVAQVLPRLRAPLILTARHPREGGSGGLGVRARRELLLRFLEHAAYVDVELRAADELETVLTAAHTGGVSVVLSFHDFRDTPSVELLRLKCAAAAAAGAQIFKTATRTDTPVQLARLVTFFAQASGPVSAMGMGGLGRISRLLLAQAGSVLNYGHLGTANVEGQWPVSLLRKRLAEMQS